MPSRSPVPVLRPFIESLWVSDHPSPHFPIERTTSVGATTVTIHLHVDNADEVIARAVQAGATIQVEVADRFYGERSGSIIDPFGHRWNIGHSIEAVSPEEMQRRYQEPTGGNR